MPDNLRKIFRSGRSKGSPSEQPIPAILPPREQRSEPILKHAEWLQDDPWHAAPVALALYGPDERFAWNLACRALLREAVGPVSGAWEAWLRAVLTNLRATGRKQDILAAGLERSLAVEVRLGPTPRPGQGQVLALREVVPTAAGKPGTPADLSESVNTLTHEIRSPLASMKSSLDLVLKEDTGPLNPDQRHFLAMTMRSIDRLDRLVTDMLDAARGEAGQLVLRPREVDLGPLLAEVAQLQAAAALQAGLTFDASGLPESYRAHIDPDKVRQILDNVLGNAIKYTDSPGLVRLWLQPRSAQAGGLAWQLANHCFLPCNQFTLVVEDSGRGMDQQAQGRLFGQFRRVHDEGKSDTPGSGLGLHITKGLVDAMQGRIRLASRPGQGTTVWIRLPRDQETARLLAATADLQQCLAAVPTDLQAAVGILDLRDDAAQSSAAPPAVAAFLQAAREEGVGQGVALAPGLWTAAILDRPRWSRLWADHWTPHRGPDHPEHWRLLPGEAPRPALESVRYA